MPLKDITQRIFAQLLTLVKQIASQSLHDFLESLPLRDNPLSPNSDSMASLPSSPVSPKDHSGDMIAHVNHTEFISFLRLLFSTFDIQLERYNVVKMAMADYISDADAKVQFVTQMGSALAAASEEADSRCARILGLRQNVNDLINI
jgi:hypothetical protein